MPTNDPAGNIQFTLGTATKVLRKHPASALALARAIANQGRAEKTRHKHAAAGLDVPPTLIVSAAGHSNLACSGCFMRAEHAVQPVAWSAERIHELLTEASELGIAMVLLADGAPQIDRRWMEALGEHRELLGIALLKAEQMDGDTVRWFAKHRTVLPAIHIEIGEVQGGLINVPVDALDAMAALQKSGALFGAAVTVNANNIDQVLRPAFVTELAARGCELFLFAEYAPTDAIGEPLALASDAKRSLAAFCEQTMHEQQMICIAFPGGEESALTEDRSFVHLDTDGRLEPCPLAQPSDRNLAQMSLQQALASPLRKFVHANRAELAQGGCALLRDQDA